VVKSIVITIAFALLSVQNFGRRRNKMNLSTATNILSLIQLYFPGGLMAFKAMNGVTFAFPDDIDRCIVCGDNFPESYRKKMQTEAKRFGAEIEFHTTYNFQGDTAEQVKLWTGKLVQFLRTNYINCLPFVNPCTIYIEAREYLSDDITKLKEFLQQSTGIVRAHIQCKDKLVEIEQERKVSKVREIQLERTKALTTDDVLNVKITLQEINSVEDFLKSF
jgi:hypothetical protein